MGSAKACSEKGAPQLEASSLVDRFWDHLFPVQNLGLHVHSSHVDEGSLIFFQSTSVLAHKLESNRERLLPTTDEEAIMAALDSDQPLGQQFEELFAEMNKHFGTPWGLMSSHRGWKGGLHIQSCGHHMHYDCRQSYCETLKQLMRVTREQVLILKIFFNCVSSMKWHCECFTHDWKAFFIKVFKLVIIF